MRPQVRPQAWLIGGTQESAQLADALAAQQIPHIITVTTPPAQQLYGPAATVRVGQLAPAAMAAFVRQHQVRCILDASHPFASEVSESAIALAQRHNIPYLRYERSEVSPADICGSRAVVSDTTTAPVVTVPSVVALAQSNLLHRQRVLLTLGYRHLRHFSHWHDTAELFARILPSEVAIAAALAAGFTPAAIIALRPPISAPLERSLWQQWNISQVVAKASGIAGGEATKRQVADQLGIQLILIQRPEIRYPQQTQSLTEAVRFCAKILRVYYPNA